MFVCTCIRIIVISYIKYTEVYFIFVIFKWNYTLVHIFQSESSVILYNIIYYLHKVKIAFTTSEIGRVVSGAPSTATPRILDRDLAVLVLMRRARRTRLLVSGIDWL